MSSKRKNDEIPLSTYDQTLLFRFYRWLRWDKTQQFTVETTPEQCKQRIDTLKEPDYFFHIKKQMTRERYEFQISIFTRGPRSTELGFVTGQIIAEQDKKTLVALRAYPGIVNSGYASALTCIGLFTTPLIPFNLLFTTEGLCIGVIILLLLTMVWRYCFGSRNDALNVIAGSFAPVAHQTPEKAKREDSL